MTHFVYADNAATTPVLKTVLDEMLPYFSEKYGNPSTLYSLGRDAREAISSARRKAALALGAEEQEIFFTSGGSEADNWAIRGIAHANASKGKHLITTKIEHHAVLHTMKALEKEGFEVTYLDVNENGIVNPSDFAAAIRPDTTLASIMYANNEIGTIQPIPELGKICSDKGIILHTDAVQAVGHLPINVKEQGVQLLSLSAHKFHGPKGIGALYIRKGLRFPNLIEGGAQEKNRRAGTENVPSIIGLGKAIEIACSSIDGNSRKTKLLRDKLIDGILKLPHTKLNGDRENRLAGNVNVSIEGVSGEQLLLQLDQNDICAASGSACTSGSLDPSHVLLAIGLNREVAFGSLRFSLSELNTEEDVDYILEVLPKIVQQLRDVSPLWKEIQEKG
ncbi:MAG TPA: cysteine desulfurase NifS [Caproicibacter sp.]|nr:cysteine desulfurase NifS [Caproicibacter sp.]